MNRYQHSLDWLDRARKVTPGGAQTLSKRAERFPEGAYPVFLERGDGAHVWDVDGNEYIDWICGLGAITLGCKNTDVRWKVGAQLADGVSFSLPHPLEVEIAERLCQKIPCAEMVRFVKTGSEATEAAIRLARSYTGNDIIAYVKTGYHSWHSWFAATRLDHPGVPHAYSHLTYGFDYNALDQVEQMFQRSDRGQLVNGHVAAIIMEPTMLIPPQSGFLEGVRDLCTKHGALLIFDEMLTGFRWALAGGQEYFKVTPDLATFGKGAANGFPLAWLCGKREIMEHASVVSGTFGGEVISLAACDAVLDVYEREKVIDHLWEIGTIFMQEFQRLIDSYELQKLVICEGYAVHPRIRFLNDPDSQQMSLFLQETARHGILFHPSGFNVSLAHTEQDVQQSIEACRKALWMVNEARVSQSWSALQGQVIQPNLFRPVS